MVRVYGHHEVAEIGQRLGLTVAAVQPASTGLVPGFAMRSLAACAGGAGLGLLA